MLQKIETFECRQQNRTLFMTVRFFAWLIYSLYLFSRLNNGCKLSFHEIKMNVSFFLETGKRLITKDHERQRHDACLRLKKHVLSSLCECNKVEA